MAGGELSEWAHSNELQPYRDSKDQGAPSAGLLLFPGGTMGSLETSGGIWREIIFLVGKVPCVPTGGQGWDQSCWGRAG